MKSNPRPFQQAVKRGCDIIGAGAGIIILSPLFAGIAVLIRLTMGRPVMFFQRRPGLHGKPFVTCKFRTMREAFSPDGKPLSDSDRLISLGRFLRKTSLDELPQLWNVFVGEMSLVGPRPLAMEYLSRYTPEQSRRHEMRPGITGLAQVTGRNAMPFSQRIACDLHYIDHYSLWLDVRILALTIFRVGTGRLYDGAGQDVRVVDDLGLAAKEPSDLGNAAARYSK